MGKLKFNYVIIFSENMAKLKRKTFDIILEKKEIANLQYVSIYIVCILRGRISANRSYMKHFFYPKYWCHVYIYLDIVRGVRSAPLLKISGSAIYSISRCVAKVINLKKLK